ncbi:MAG: sulfatase-like hydrolase/transferase [Pseudomonadales bacterium]|nr:sulfatase-like hydrolase/transferase [Pseudomonadales bacterium]MCP5214911.1 sulfatase-like hydrolase/transferase [Pseudomonadales bacterium]
MQSIFITRQFFIVCFIYAGTLFFASLSASNTIASTVFAILATIAQTALFTFPLYLLHRLALNSRWSATTKYILAITLTAVFFVSIMLLAINYKLNSMYGFFINGFVMNLISTPGGLEAMGASQSFYYSVATLVLAALIFYGLLIRYVPFEKLIPFIPRKSILAALIMADFLAQSSMYAVADFTSNTSILSVANRIVWQIPITVKGLLTSLGLKQTRTLSLEETPSGAFKYPDKSTLDVQVNRPLNVVWLVAESWRADMLNPRVMPATSQFAKSNIQFTEHRSSGNGTRMGIFGQFYGLYGRYWFDALHARQSPLILDILQHNGYQMMAYTSARFAYPEFDKTVFSQFKNSELQEYYEGQGWQRDRKNVTDLLAYVDSAKDPFFAFMFFESAHAKYHFPKESIIEEDYIEDFDYLTTDIVKNIRLIKNRYINSARHLDQQLARVFAGLKATGKLENTIVIVTGDHGEEFLEKGHWGHNSTFSDEQIRVPLIIHTPQNLPRTINKITSHLDLPATLLSLLQVNIKPELYSFGQNLLSPDYSRKYLVVSDWHGDAVITPSVKYILSSTAASNGEQLTDGQDRLIRENSLSAGDRGVFTQYVKSLARFY